MKVCSRCSEAKSLDAFGRQTAKSDGLAPHCKACAAIYDRTKRNAKARAARLKAERQKDPERFATYERTKRQRHGVKLNAAAKLRKRRWKVERKDVYLASERRYYTQPHRRLIARIRSRTRAALRLPRGSTIALLGCTTEQLQTWLERFFVEGMGWHNMERWHLDHHWPLALFDLTDPRQLAKACHFRNLRPLWAEDNHQKGDRLPHEEMQRFEAWRATL